MPRALYLRTGSWCLILTLGVLLGSGCGQTGTGPPPGPLADEAAGAGSRIHYQEIAVADGGRLEGRVLFEGGVPEYPKIRVTRQADQTVCGLEKKSHRVRVGPGGEVMDALVTLRGIRRGKSLTALEAAAVSRVDCHFEPHLVIHPTGAPLSLRNEDPMLHRVQASDGSGQSLFDLSLPRRGMQVSRFLPDSGWVNLECDLHPWMSAGLWITSHPYAVATDEAGAFVLDEIPAGEHRVEVRHPALGTVETTVRVEAEKTTRVTLRLPGVDGSGSPLDTGRGR